MLHAHRLHAIVAQLLLETTEGKSTPQFARPTQPQRLRAVLHCIVVPSLPLGTAHTLSLGHTSEEKKTAGPLQPLPLFQCGPKVKSSLLSVLLVRLCRCHRTLDYLELPLILETVVGVLVSSLSRCVALVALLLVKAMVIRKSKVAVVAKTAKSPPCSDSDASASHMQPVVGCPTWQTCIRASGTDTATCLSWFALGDTCFRASDTARLHRCSHAAPSPLLAQSHPRPRQQHSPHRLLLQSTASASSSSNQSLPPKFHVKRKTTKRR